MNSKTLLASKTIWFNLLTLLAISVVAVQDSTIITENPVLVGAVAVIGSLINLALRLVTKSAIK